LQCSEKVQYADYLKNVSDELAAAHGLMSCVGKLKYLLSVVILRFMLNTIWRTEMIK